MSGFWDFMTTPVEDTVAQVSDNRASIESIVEYMKTTTVKTSGAQKVKEQFFSWYDSLVFIGSDDDYKRATNYRNDFNRANAATGQEKKQVEDVITQSVESPGRPDLQGRRDSAGNFIVASPGFLDTVSSTLLALGIGLVTGAATLGGFLLYRKIR